MFGLEIEFIANKQLLFQAFKTNNIEYVYYDKMKTEKHDIIVLKPEKTLKHENGIEINFPPSDDFMLIKQVLHILNSLDISFNEHCALHVHVGISNEDELEQLKSFYIKHQDEIISEAMNHDVYINLNKPVLETDNLVSGKFRNMNLYYSFKTHQTVEHRIYKATINFDEVKFCIEQTLNIISAALKCPQEDAWVTQEKNEKQAIELMQKI